jgi:hypothetical protein
MLLKLSTLVYLCFCSQLLWCQASSLILHHKVLGRIEVPKSEVRCILSSPQSSVHELILAEGGNLIGVLEGQSPTLGICKRSALSFFIRLTQGDQIPAMLKSQSLLLRTRQGDIQFGPSIIENISNLGTFHRISGPTGQFEGFLLSERLDFDSTIGKLSLSPSLLASYQLQPEQMPIIKLKLQRRVEPILNLIAYPLGPDEFIMGEDSNDPLLQDAKPIHPVSLSKFYLSRSEVTLAEWNQIMGKQGRPSNHSCKPCPVTEISSDDIEVFLERLNSQSSSWTYRLPTEAEWEYAARKWGKLPKANQTLEKSLHPVCSKTPDDLFCDLLGNAWEWTSSLKSPYTKQKVVNQFLPRLKGRRVYRGGSYNNLPAVRHPAYRGSAKSSLRDPSIGFRLVIEEGGSHE